MRSLFIAIALALTSVPATAVAAPSAQVVEMAKRACPLLLEYPSLPAEVKIEALMETLRKHNVSETDQLELLKLCTAYIKYRTEQLEIKTSI